MQLSSVFPGRVAVTPAELGAAVFGWSSKTVQNRLLRGAFPFPTVTLGGKRVCLLAAVEVALAGAAPLAPPAPSPAFDAAAPKRGRGRPRKMMAGG